MRPTLILLLLFTLFTSTASDRKTDSLLQIINNSKVDTVLMKTHYELLRRLKSNDPGTAIQHGKLALAYALRGTDLRLLGKIYNNLGTAYGNVGSNIKAYDHYMLAYKTHLQDKDSVAAYIAWYNIGLIRSDEGKLNEAMEYYVAARKVFQMYNDTNNMVLPIMGTGGVYAKLGKYQESLKEFQDAREIIERTGDMRKLSTALNNIASTYAYMGDWQGSYNTFKEALELHRSQGSWEGVSMVMFNISTPLMKMGKVNEAMMMLDSSIMISKSKGYLHNLGVAYQNKAELLMQLKRWNDAEEYVKKGIEIAREFKEGDVLISLYHSAHKIYEQKGDYKGALHYFTLSTELRDSLVNVERLKVEATEKEFEKEMVQKEKDLLNKEKELEEQRVKNTRMAGALMLAALAVVIVVLYLRYLGKQKSNRILQEMNAIIAQKNKDITDSISYASRIQQAILPEKEMKFRLFPEAFVLLLPRDVVSGDFYWFGERNGDRIIAAVDCTGHGVPGAFMSMIGNAFLNQIVLEDGITDPGQILNRLREKVKHSLKQTGAEDDSRDGMDAALCVISPGNKVKYAGANNPLWIFRNDGTFSDIKPDKLPVGTALVTERPFTTHSVDLSAGDLVYIFSDGFADQFGGSNNKKMTNRKFREFIQGISRLSCREQEEKLRAWFTEWKGAFEQTDDVLVIGVRMT
ncbi:MAG: tetratricopeptide repeat protein [Bacteroidia bacterium]|nr:tetratricopeptide repeat protein [Bacteroidia bacterium]